MLLAGSVRRDRLLQRIARERDALILLVTAPAGYGKSTLLREWAEEDARPAALLALEERHNDPGVLHGDITAMLDRIGSARGGDPLVLILDDLHRIRHPECLDALVEIAQSMPASSQLVLAGRSEPELPLGRMRAHRLLSELDADDLRMDVAEAGEMLSACGLDLRRDAVGQLVERTEGWPAGLYLAALSLSREDRVSAAIADFHGDDRLVADYIRDEFLAGMDEDTLEFLVKTSIFDRFSGDLCDAVLERAGSAGVLRSLARSNLLIIPLDRRDHDYRHHPLLKDMLHAELGRSEASLQSRLHIRASEWFRESGDIDSAVFHAIQSGDRALAADLIWASAVAYVNSGRHATVRGWLDHYSDEQLATSPKLCLACATVHLAEGSGDEVESWTASAVAQLEDMTTAEDAALAATARVLRAAGAARDGAKQMRVDAQEGLEHLSPSSPWRALCHLVDGVSHHLCGDREGAERPLEDGARSGANGLPSVAALCRAQLALLALDEGEADEAERQAGLALQQIDNSGLGGHPTHALVFAVSTLVHARRGQANLAAVDAKTAVGLQASLREITAWYEAETHITLARALLHLDDGVAARSHLASAGRYLRKVDDAVVLREWLDAAWAEAEVAGSVVGRWPLTPAELKLLHALPTHFSFRQIADQSFVSQNTVKTQAQSVYRKLGVSSRAEAVACARAAGLLDAVTQDSPERGDARPGDGA